MGGLWQGIQQAFFWVRVVVIVSFLPAIIPHMYFVHVGA